MLGILIKSCIRGFRAILAKLVCSTECTVQTLNNMAFRAEKCVFSVECHFKTELFKAAQSDYSH
jgi:hypothetical protein